jgi:hypothetical protein
MKRWSAVATTLRLGASVALAEPQAEKTLTPTDNLIVQGVPPIPASLAAQVSRYSEFRSARLGSLHPLRREMLITTRFPDTIRTNGAPVWYLEAKDEGHGFIRPCCS